MTQPPLPTLAEWILCALERREHDLERIGTCASAQCMCSMANPGDRHAADCHCYDRKHAMIELAKINSTFVSSVKDALK
jgi:hypothetical protein